MQISLIVASDEAGGIGFQGQLPWRLPADLQRFKSLTLGHHMLMGRKTFESIGRLLPGRASVVISHNPHYTHPACTNESCVIVASLEDGLQLASARGESEVFVIGGSQIFAQVLPLAQRIYLTQVHARVPADVFFPALQPTEWVEVEQEYHPADEKNQYAFTFKILEREKSRIHP